MARFRGPGRLGDEIRVISEAGDWRIGQRVLSNYLPGLSTAALYNREIWLDNLLSDVEMYVGDAAIAILFEYLEEVTYNGQSGALAQRLEDLWRHSMSGYGMDDHFSVDSIARVFYDLGQLLSPAVLGCNEKLFSCLKDFFNRHLTSMVRSNDEIFFVSLSALDQIAEFRVNRLETVIANIIAHAPALELVDQYSRDYALRQSFPLSADLMAALSIQDAQAENREWSGFPSSSMRQSNWDYPIWTSPMRPMSPYIRRPSMPYRMRRGGQVNGTEFGTRAIAAIAACMPECITVDTDRLASRRAGPPYTRNPFLDWPHNSFRRRIVP